MELTRISIKTMTDSATMPRRNIDSEAIRLLTVATGSPGASSRSTSATRRSARTSASVAVMCERARSENAGQSDGGSKEIPTSCWSA